MNNFLHINFIDQSNTMNYLIYTIISLLTFIQFPEPFFNPSTRYYSAVILRLFFFLFVRISNFSTLRKINTPYIYLGYTLYSMENLAIQEIMYVFRFTVMGIQIKSQSFLLSLFIYLFFVSLNYIIYRIVNSMIYLKIEYKFISVYYKNEPSFESVFNFYKLLSQ